MTSVGIAFTALRRCVVSIKVLRDAGFSLAQIRNLLNPTDANSREILFADHIQKLNQQRTFEDQSLNQAKQLLIDSKSDIVDVEVVKRDALPYIAHVVSPLQVNDENSEVTQEIEGMFQRIGDSGVKIVGSWWMTARKVEGTDQVELVYHWPLDALPSGDLLWPGDETGVLPPRRELVRSWPIDPDNQEDNSALVIAHLAEILEEHGIEPESPHFRQPLDAKQKRGTTAVTLNARF